MHATIRRAGRWPRALTLMRSAPVPGGQPSNVRRRSDA